MMKSIKETHLKERQKWFKRYLIGAAIIGIVIDAHNILSGNIWGIGLIIACLIMILHYAMWIVLYKEID